MYDNHILNTYNYVHNQWASLLGSTKGHIYRLKNKTERIKYNELGAWNLLHIVVPYVGMEFYKILHVNFKKIWLISWLHTQW